MGEWLASAWDDIGRVGDRHIRAFTIAISLIAVPAALLYLVPVSLQAIARPFDQRLADAGGQPQAFTFLDAAGQVIGRRGPVAGRALPLSEMPAYLPAAFLAMEDRRFWRHKGVDFVGLGRAAFTDLRARRAVAGGSSISQQTAKILFGKRERTLSRKLHELINTASLEKSLSKPAILALYLNHLYLGDGAYGVDTAARTYFGISAREVTLPQAAMLAGLTQAPSVYSPRRDLGLAQRRATLVLAAMVETGAITPAQAAAAAAQPATITPRPADTRSYALDVAAEEARRLTADSGPGEVIVHTTLRSDLQASAEGAAAQTVSQFGRKLDFEQAALVVMKTDGAITALVGGVDYRRSEFNRVTQAHRQPGSAFKPFVYLAALQEGISPWDWRDDRPVDVAGYQPANYKDVHYGRLRLSDALARSVNTITVNLAQEVGIARVAAAARQAGITSPLENNASLALGTNEVTPLELASAYGFLATGGHQVKPFLVSRIEDATTGALLYQHEDTDTPALMADQVHKDMNAMLYQVVTAGTGTAARLGAHEVAGKTGTTQDYRDAWFAGFTHDHVAVAWVGNDDNHPMRKVTGGSVPAMLWRAVMTVAEKDLPPVPLDRSPGAPVEVNDPFGATQVSYVDDLNAAPPLVPMESEGEYFAGSGTSASRVARNDPPTPYVPPAYTPPPYAPQPYAAQAYAPVHVPPPPPPSQPYAPQAYAPVHVPPPPEPVQERTSEQPWREVRQSPYQAYRERAPQEDEVRQLPYQAYRERVWQGDEGARRGYGPGDYGPPRSAYGPRDYDYPGR